MLLNSVAVNYPVHPVDDETRRFIPESQRTLIQGFLEQPFATQTFIARKKYATNVDDRNFLSVYEYTLNEQWIIWDYCTGYVFFTGLWKACGNTKTDIVKLVENFPSLQTAVKRVRGGFLKIQGTWLPFDIVHELAKNFAFTIRYALVPLFGADFPNECLRPGDANYGKLVDVNAPAPVRQRRRTTLPGITKPNGMMTHGSLTATAGSAMAKQRRSQSDSHHAPTEMAELLAASRQLHELSRDRVARRRSSSFQYGGFVWLWHDDEQPRILGRDEEAVVDEDSPTYVESTSQRKTPTHSAPQLSAYAYDQQPPAWQAIPKSFDGHETVVKAAQQLLHFSSASGTRDRGKMDIGGLLS